MLKDFIGLLYPPCCLCCSTVLDPNEEHICLTCKTAFPRTYFESLQRNQVEKVFEGRLLLHAATALWYFYSESRTQELMHALKYQNSKEAGIYMGQKLGASIKKEKRFPKFDIIIPVPLHKKKLNKRGYNQAALIGKGMLHELESQLNETALLRLEYNESQTKKSRFSRWLNVETIFKLVKPEEVKGKNVLLVDDVVTTGATLEACGKELLKGNVKSLSIATVAYTA